MNREEKVIALIRREKGRYLPLVR